MFWSSKPQDFGMKFMQLERDVPGPYSISFPLGFTYIFLLKRFKILGLLPCLQST